MTAQAEQFGERLARLEREAALLRDVEEIKKLKARYCDYVDLGWELEDPDRKERLIYEVFAEDVVWEVPTANGLIERFEGRDQVRQQYDTAVAVFRFGIHLAMNPIIEVDGDSAIGQWPVLVPLTAPNGVPIWLAGKYLEKYRRTAVGWRISYLKEITAFCTPFDVGWEAVRMYDFGSPDPARANTETDKMGDSDAQVV